MMLYLSIVSVCGKEAHVQGAISGTWYDASARFGLRPTRRDATRKDWSTKNGEAYGNVDSW